MRIVVSPAIQTDHDRLTELAAAGFAGVDADGVEVHLERARPRAAVFVGRAYPELPSRPRTHDGARYLVRLMLPSVIRNRGYPVTYRYRGLSTAPWITVQDWRERLVALAAHEAYHVHQFREGLRRSEVQAERWALRRLSSWRAEPRVADLERFTGSAAAPEATARARATQLTLFDVA
jgi:hypothetical protein